MTNVEEKKVRNVLKGETFEVDETARRVFFCRWLSWSVAFNGSMSL
jgi:hypothetical protein